MTIRERSVLALISVVCALTIAGDVLMAQDWPQWRGPNRDGVVISFREPASWPESLNQEWTVEVGSGYATPILVGDRIYMHARQDEDEVMMALDAATGDVIWQTGYAAPFRMNPAARRHGPGPKATPTFAEDRLYTLGMSGIVSAFDANSGEHLWRTEADRVGPLYGTSMSPLVDGERVIVHIGGHDRGALTAFNRETGTVEWSWDGDGPAYGSPVIAEFDGLRHVITFTQENLIGVSASTGELLWRRPFTTRSTQNTITPILHGRSVIVSGLGNPTTAFTVLRRDNGWVTENIWENPAFSLYMTNGVVVGGVLFGLSHRNSGQYFALDAETGTTLWTSEGRQATNAAILGAGDLLFMLEYDAELRVARAGRNGLTPLRLYTVADSATWAHPTIAGNRIFVKDVSTLTLWTLN